MDFKFRATVRVKPAVSKILRPDGVPSQAEFFEGSEGTVLRYDPVKGGYLLVLNCPEVAATMGETITAYFNEYELEPIQALTPPRFVYEQTEALAPYQAVRAKNNRAKRMNDD